MGTSGKPKSPTPEPPPVLKQENTLASPQIQKLQAQETDEESKRNGRSELKEENKKIEPSVIDNSSQESKYDDKTFTEPKYDDSILEEQFEGDTELNEENFIKLVCEKRSQ